MSNVYFKPHFIQYPRTNTNNNWLHYLAKHALVWNLIRDHLFYSNSYMKSQVLLREKIVMHNCYKN